MPKTWPGPSSAPNAERNINLLIDHQCPQCGAPAQLSETDRLFQCTFCKVKSFLAEQGCFRYVLPQKAPGDERLVYFPYWRFKGMLFSCLNSGIQHRFLDVSQQAASSPLFPASVGLRSQALKLNFVSPETPGWFIKPSRPFKQAMDDFIQLANRDIPGPILHQSHVGESLSLIYAPFYLGRNRIVDAVLNQPISGELDEGFDWAQFPGGQADWRIRFIPTLCPHCGWDMQGRRDALVLHCPNCESMWQASKKGLTRVNAAHMAGTGGAHSIYLPFWRIRADVSGIRLKSYADLVKLANLPKVVQPAWTQTASHFWCPAFKVRPQSFLRLIHHTTLAQPRDAMVARVPDGEMHPVNLPLAEAVETLKLNLAGIIRPRKLVQTHIGDIQVNPARFLLIYLPFEVRHHDFVQPRFNIAVNRNQLALAGNL